MGFRKNRHEEIVWPKHLVDQPKTVEENLVSIIDVNLNPEKALELVTNVKNALVELPNLPKVKQIKRTTKKSTSKKKPSAKKSVSLKK